MSTTRFYFAPEPIRELDLPTSLPEIRIATPEQNFGSHGGAREINALYEDSPHDHVIWQPDVYAEARCIADSFAIKRVVDVGCGNGEKLIHFFPTTEFESTGLDFHGSLALARAAHPDANFIECDLNSIQDLARVFDEMEADEPLLLILSDVIEHIPDPRVLLGQLRTVLLKHPSNRLVLSTPDRALLDYEFSGDYPKNRAHVREWTHEELVLFCQASGFQVERYGHTRANQFDENYSTIYIQLRCEPTQYMEFLRTNGLVHDHVMPRHLLVTSEYAGLHSTGGIGSFVVEQRLIYGVEHTLCLYIGSGESQNDEVLRRFKLISPRMLIDEVSLSAPMEEIALAATLQLLFYFPDISKIEYPDYQGVGCRVAQAKRAGILPPSLQVVVHCHGATHYLENAHQTWYGSSHFCVAEREKVSVEKADTIVFPTAFLQNLYREAGFLLPEDKLVHLRYPYQFKAVPITRTEAVDTIVFYGKRSPMKGYSLLLAALAADKGQLFQFGIKRLIFIGPRVSETPDDIAHFSVLRSRYEVEEHTSLSRAAAMEKLGNVADRSICVMPYMGDNHPYALLDVAFAGVLPLMLRTGGVSELFPAPFDRTLLSEPTESALLSAMHAIVKISSTERHKLRVGFIESMTTSQLAINDEVRRFGELKAAAHVQPKKGRATVIVPVFNTDLRYLTDLVFGLNNQSTLPEEIIFIDDASREGYRDQLNSLLQRELRLPFRIISHPVNKGLSGARNTGLHATNTEYVINVDSDDVPLNDFVRNIVNCLDANPSCAAAVPYLKAFDEESDFNMRRFDGYVYRPLGDGVIAAQLDNILGHANSGYRVNVLRSLGGWDESDKSMWEDWALYLKLVSSGYCIGVIPQPDCLYRVRKESMLRTYKVWPAMRRLARNTAGLSRYETFRLQAVMRSMRDEAHVTSILRSENAMLAAELNRRSIRVVRRTLKYLAKYPRAFGIARDASIGLGRLARRLRHLATKK